jgi:hypothetical protein
VGVRLLLAVGTPPHIQYNDGCQPPKGLFLIFGVVLVGIICIRVILTGIMLVEAILVVVILAVVIIVAAIPMIAILVVLMVAIAEIIESCLARATISTALGKYLTGSSIFYDLSVCRSLTMLSSLRYNSYRSHPAHSRAYLRSSGYSSFLLRWNSPQVCSKLYCLQPSRRHCSFKSFDCRTYAISNSFVWCD